MEKHPIEGRTIYCMKAEDRSNKDENWYGRGGQGKGGKIIKISFYIAIYTPEGCFKALPTILPLGSI